MKNKVNKKTIKKAAVSDREQKKTVRRKKERLQAPKGMHDILGKRYYHYQGFFIKAQEIATFYGFEPIELPILEKEEVFISGVGANTNIAKEMYRLKTKGGDRLVMRPEGTAGVMRAYIQHGMQTLPQPVMLYYYGPFFRHERPQRGRFREMRQFGLEILGTEKSIADAIIIRTTTTILEEAGAKNVIININSIGCRECRGDYIYALTTYYKKYLSQVCGDCKKRIKSNPLRMLDCKSKKCQPIKEDAPDSVSFLCNDCKEHFKKTLEYLEAIDIPYQLNKNLVRGIDYYTRTVFEIIQDPADADPLRQSFSEARASADRHDLNNLPASPNLQPASPSLGGRGEATVPPPPHSAPKPGEAEKVIDLSASALATAKNQSGRKETEGIGLAIAGGGRYDYLSKTLGSKIEVPAVGAAIGVDRVVQSFWYKKLVPHILKKPKFYFISLGFEARLKSSKIIESLRKVKIPVKQMISNEKIGEQLARAEKLKIPYVIILGQREAVEDTIIVRDMNTRSQKTIPIIGLADYLKKMK